MNRYLNSVIIIIVRFKTRKFRIILGCVMKLFFYVSYYAVCLINGYAKKVGICVKISIIYCNGGCLCAITNS